MKKFRKLIVARACHNEACIDLGFEDSCVAIVIPNKKAIEYGLTKTKVGDIIFLCGSIGNEDCMLASPNCVDEIYLLPS